MLVLDPFHILLNNISNELDGRSLGNLVHVCRNYIPGGQRENIAHGWDLFSILLHQNVIGSDQEKVVNLLKIIKVMRPKRRDLVNLVKQHIKDNYVPDEILAAELESSVASTDGLRLVQETGGNVPVQIFQSRCCSFDCCCFKCSCYPCRARPCVCAILTAVLVFLTMVAALCWYSDVPKLIKLINKDSDLQESGKYIIGLLGFLAVCCACCFIYLKFSRREVPYRLVQPHEWDVSSTVSTVSSAARPTRIIGPRGNERGGTGGSPITTCSSVASIYSSRYARPMLGPEMVTDGFQEEETTDYFSPGNDDDESQDSGLVF